jgi:putative nucleotidyltransferase with HDIG domain
MSEFSWIVINFVALSPFGIIMALAYQNWGIFAIVLFFGPFLLARYSYSLYIDMKNIYIDTIKVLSNAIDAKDEYTAGHSHRVGQYAKLIAVEMGYYGKTLEKIESAAILHDIGKIGVEDRILNKSTSLTDHEMDEIKKHPGIGADIISDIDYLKSASDFVRYHHERYSGKGYPSGKTGEELPVEACIIALADAFDAMTTDRAYRKAFSLDKALTIIKEEKGEQFHPEVVDAFLKLVNSGRIMRVNEDLRVEEHVN